MSSEPPPSSIDVEVLSMRELEAVSLREGAGAPSAPGPVAAQAGKAIHPPAHAGATPARSEPPPREALVPPPQQASKKAVARLPFFQVDDPRLPPPVEEEVDLEERGPDSGLIDIRSMGSIEEKATHEGRADAAIFNLSGGLFGSNGLGPIAPPDMNALMGAPDSARFAGAGRPAASARVAPVLVPSSGPATERRQHTVALAAANRSARIGWIVALIAGSAAVILLALKLGTSLSESGGPATESTATATASPPLETSAPSAAAKPAAAPGAVEASSSAKPSASSGKPSGGPSATPRATGPSGPATPAATGQAQAKGGTGPATPPATAAPAKPETAPPPPSEGGDFDVSAARAALTAAAGKASGCKQPDDPSGGAKVSVTFAPSGRVTSARVTGPPFQGTPTGGCVASAFRGASVPPFGGSSVTVTKEVNLR